VFNGKSCAECHAVPSPGGSGSDLDVALETRIGTLVNGRFDPMEYTGGGLLQQRSIHCVEPEVVPAETTFVSQRATTPLFGLGLIEAIPDSAILQRADPDDSDGDGISGRPNFVFNPDTGQTELGRFGWKAQVATVHQFSGDAYLNEMGITSPTFPHENKPQGQRIPRGCDTVDDPEDDGSSVNAFANFMRFLAPAPRRSITEQVQRGERVFSQIGCASCHVPTMTTGNDPVEALRYKQVHLFSDLLLHKMGPGLADGIEQGRAKGDEFRTAPLWGLSYRNRFLHDGGSKTIKNAILRHGGEAHKARNRFEGLDSSDHEALLVFLGSL
jgi:CxxC motif-containing protein (DUF1111 family)